MKKTKNVEVMIENGCYHMFKERYGCEAIKDKHFAECHAKGRNCPAYRTLKDQIEIEKRLKPMVESKGLTYKSCVNTLWI